MCHAVFITRRGCASSDYGTAFRLQYNDCRYSIPCCGVCPDADGKAVVATAPSVTTDDSETTLTAGDEINGYALDAATAAGEEIRVLRGI